MARKPRIHSPGALYHVILRGNARQNIFFDNEDRNHFYRLLQENTERFGNRFHAFCLMTNHVHLAVQVGTIPLSRIMQNLSFRYTRWINRRQNRSGHLFQGRYQAVLVDVDAYLLQLVAYIHLNPVRAGMVKTPAEYRWSSHLSYLSKETIPWLTTEAVLSHFSNNPVEASGLFSAFVTDRTGEGYRDDFHSGGKSDCRVLGEDVFLETALSHAEWGLGRKPGLDAVITAIAGLYRLTDEEFSAKGQGMRISEARSMAAWAVQELTDASLTELAKRIGSEEKGTVLIIDYSCVETGVKSLSLHFPNSLTTFWNVGNSRAACKLSRIKI